MPSYKKLLSSISFPKKSQHHVAKHLEQLDAELVRLMSTSQADRNNHYVGSKFLGEFATHPLQIIDRIIEKGRVERFENMNYSKIEMEVRFSQSDFANGIGYDCIVPIEDLPDSERSGLKIESRGGSKVMIYEATRNIPTDILQLILHRNANKWEVTTCFPGRFAPSLPHTYFKTNQLRDAAAQFWKEHTFVRQNLTH